MQVISEIKLMRQEAQKWLLQRKTVGFVPTMGALHPGHLSLVKKCTSENDITVVSIFVNPKQFAPHEDYHRYPRTLEKDLELLKPSNVDVVFNPESQEIFPPDSQTRVSVEKLSQPLYGKVRPHFFGGVALVVLKLFHLVSPTRAYFGEKDYQQLLVVRQMVKDLNLDIEIIACPIVREENGLAMSSRNAYLPSEDRKNAGLLYAALQEGEHAVRKGEKNGQTLLDLMKTTISRIPNAVIDYVTVADPLSLEPQDQITKDVFLGLSVRLGETRLLDGIVVRAGTSPVPHR